MKVVPDYFQKMQQVPGNSQLTICKHGITRKWLHFQNVRSSWQFQFIYSELEIVRNWRLFQNLAKTQQKKPKSDSWQFLAHIQQAGNCQKLQFFLSFLQIFEKLAIFMQKLSVTTNNLKVVTVNIQLTYSRLGNARNYLQTVSSFQQFLLHFLSIPWLYHTSGVPFLDNKPR